MARHTYSRECSRCATKWAACCETSKVNPTPSSPTTRLPRAYRTPSVSLPISILFTLHTPPSRPIAMGRCRILDSVVPSNSSTSHRQQPYHQPCTTSLVAGAPPAPPVSLRIQPQASDTGTLSATGCSCEPYVLCLAGEDDVRRRHICGRGAAQPRQGAPHPLHPHPASLRGHPKPSAAVARAITTTRAIVAARSLSPPPILLPYSSRAHPIPNRTASHSIAPYPSPPQHTHALQLTNKEFRTNAQLKVLKHSATGVLCLVLGGAAPFIYAHPWTFILTGGDARSHCLHCLIDV